MPHLNRMTSAHFNGYSTDEGTIVPKRLEFWKHLALDSQLDLFEGATQFSTMLEIMNVWLCLSFFLSQAP